EVRRAQDGVNARRPGDSKLKRTCQLSWSQELGRQRVSEDGNALIPQNGDKLGQIGGSELFGQYESRYRTAGDEKIEQVSHGGGQGEAGELVVLQVERGQ